MKKSLCCCQDRGKGSLMRKKLLRGSLWNGAAWEKQHIERHSLRVCIKVKLQKSKNRLNQMLEKKLEIWLSVNGTCCSDGRLEFVPSLVV